MLLAQRRSAARRLSAQNGRRPLSVFPRPAGSRPIIDAEGVGAVTPPMLLTSHAEVVLTALSRREGIAREISALASAVGRVRPGRCQPHACRGARPRGGRCGWWFPGSSSVVTKA
jgi:hypothetical protein